MISSQAVINRNRKNALAKFIDLTGSKFGRLKVIERVFKYPKTTSWMCLCDCGVYSIVNGGHLKAGRIKSCGCLNREITSDMMMGNDYGKVHGLGKHPLRDIRKAMLQRCYNEKNRFFKNYGGRGISVCDEWKNSLECFVEWALNNEWKKGLSIDRKDNNGNYTPENCEWITVSENSRKNCIIGKLRKEKRVRNNSSSQL